MSDASEIIRGRLEAGRTIADADVRALLRERDQLWQDRYDALSVHAKEGMLASEWIARTGKAERERDAARSEAARLEADLKEARRYDGTREDIISLNELLDAQYEQLRSARRAVAALADAAGELTSCGACKAGRAHTHHAEAEQIKRTLTAHAAEIDAARQLETESKENEK